MRHAHGGGLKERVSLEAGFFRDRRTGNQQGRFPLNGNHIRLQLRYHGACSRRLRQVKPFLQFTGGAKSGIQINTACGIRQYPGIVLKKVVLFFTENRPVFVMNMPIIFIGAGWRAADSDTDGSGKIKSIIKIKPAVRPLLYVRGEQSVILGIRSAGVLDFPVDNSLIAPVSQILNRGRPADVIIETKILSVKSIMAAVYIDPVAEYMRLSVRHIFIAR